MTAHPPVADLEALSQAEEAQNEAQTRLELEFVRQAPFLPGAVDLAAASSAVTPWPHQLAAMRRAVSRYPEGFLFCDEVGLGKTVEAGLALRSLWIAERVRRVLLLVPAALLRQWQEELHEKFALDALVFAGDRFVDVHGHERRTRPGQGRTDENPWNRHDLILASSQLARRAERRDQLLRAELWDLVVVDEAHHARRRDPESEGYRPNRLLELLAGQAGSGDATKSVSGLVHRSRCLWLLTATPMQIHPQEFWDLLALVGVRSGGATGDHDGNDDATGPDPRQVRRRVFRQTRQVLRRYRDQGLLDAAVPVRRPENVWIDLDDEARAVYLRIETYLSLFYRRYEAERRGLGFVMTVYRRRLTSSFEAIRRSLLRRRERLRAGGPTAAYEGEDEGVDERGDGPGLFDSAAGAGELAHLESFFDDLAALEADPKVERLRVDLRELLGDGGRDRALVFTQYLDTLDHLRDVLSPEWRVACWSGRGGEILRDDTWRPVGKEELKAAFGRGEIQVLLATDAASEGLNLQSCGVIVHFDLPWNPMRVEQRIGRIDRIGQVHDEIWIRSYFYAGTVEAEVYRRLAHRIRWFEQVVGELQPILHRVGETLEEVAMLPPERRQRSLEEKLLVVDDLMDRRSEGEGEATWHEMAACQEISEAETDLETDLETDSETDSEPSPPLTPADVEDIVLTADGGRGLAPDGEDGVFRLRLARGAEGHGSRVTFRPQVYDAHPYSTRLLTWGVPHFHALLDELTQEVGVLRDSGTGLRPGCWSAEQPAGVGLYRSERPAPVALFLHPGGEAATLDDLRRLAREAPAAWRPDGEAEVASRFSALRREALRAREDIEERRRRSERRGLRDASARCLTKLALLELVEAENPGLFDLPSDWGFGRRAVRELARHGAPLDELVQLLERADGLPTAREDDPWAFEARNHRKGWRERRRRLLMDEAEDCLRRWRALDDAEDRARRRLEEPSAGLLSRRWLRLGPAEESSDVPTLLDAADVVPFTDAVPALGDLDDAAARLLDAAEEGRDLLGELSEVPGDSLWLRDDRAGRRRFAARLVDGDLEPRTAAGSWLLFEADPRRQSLRPGDLYLLRVDGRTLVRRMETRMADGSSRLVLSADAPGTTVVVEEPDPDAVQVLARVV